MLARLTQRFKKGGLARNALTVTLGTLAAQALLIAVTPLLTRLYTPADFGVLAVFTAIVSITGAVTNLRYETAIPLDGRDEDAAATFLAAVITGFATTCLVALVVALCGEQLVTGANVPGLGPLLWAIPIGTLGMAFYNATNLWAVRRQAFRAVALSKLAQFGFMAVWQVLHGWLAKGPAGLVVGQALGQPAGIVNFLRSFDVRDRALLRATSLSAIRAAAVRHYRFPLLLTPSLLLNTSAKMLPAVFLATLYGPVVAGQFGLAQRVVLAPVRLLGMSIGQAYLGAAPKLAREDRAALLRLFRSTTFHLAWIGLLGMAAVAIPAPFLFALVFGEAWREAGVQLQILSIMYLAQFVIFPVGQTLAMFGRQDLNLWWDIGNMAITLLAFLIGWGWQLSSNQTLLLYSVAMSANYGVNWLLSHHAILHGQAAGSAASAAVTTE
ncbi:MAG TPA: oligosaccharide flippase family protein [Geminicoccus sp.]|uniref:lipopolysaccharide biosynthesis protein n=1 Tax=Geminicoccus sp. TaxID=2024832 RepID=UPI002BFDFE4E|nr:oligosaccharide flippase family protein [Geminicoccus sp.]HWL67503.1 oligosaccharide flippase family protein [Geminicoccus sp.]